MSNTKKYNNDHDNHVNDFFEKTQAAFKKSKEEVWDQIMKDRGSVANLPEDVMPLEDKQIFLTFAEINQLALVEQAAVRQKYIDQTQSLNLAFDPTDSPKFINLVHKTAWKLGIKTLYYLRTDSVINGDIGSRTSEVCLACDG